MGTIRTKIADLETQVKSLKEQISTLRRDLPPEVISTVYEFPTAFKPKKLADLFGEKASLIVIHNMGQSCAYCTLWLDTIEGFYSHLKEFSSLCVSSPDEGVVQMEFKIGRDYHFPFVSTAGTSFAKDMGFQSEKGSLIPGFSVFTRDESGTISRVSSDQFGPYDDYCGIWGILSHIPKARRPEWKPRSAYESQNPEGISGRVNFLLNYCKDVEGSRAFYQKYFGFKEEHKYDEASKSVYGNMGNTGMWIGAFNQENDPSHLSARMAPMLEVRSARKLFNRLKQDGIKLHFDEPRNMGGKYWFQFTDPEGNVIEVLGG